MRGEVKVPALKVEIGDFLGDEDLLVLGKIREHGNAWIVGGWVRDFLSGRNVSGCLDIATTLRPDQVKEIFPRTLLVGEKYGTVIVRLEDPPEGFWEVTTLRRDGGYGDGRRPDNVSFGNDLLVDLSRRDFTINAMAIAQNGEIIDIEGRGMEDLGAGIIRTVGNAADRISEDGLRIMRAFRFLDDSEKGIRTLDPELSEAIRSNIQMLERVSKERIWSELCMILSGENVKQILELMGEHGIIGSILPDIEHNYGLEFSNNPRVNLALLCSPEGNSGKELSLSLREVLKISNDDSLSVSFLHDTKNVDFDLSPESVRRFRCFLPEYLQREFLLYSEGLGKNSKEMEDAINTIPKNSVGNSPLVDGNILSEVTGLEPGRRLGKLKGWLHRRQIEDNLESTEQILELLKEIDWSGEDPEKWKSLSWP